VLCLKSLESMSLWYETNPTILMTDCWSQAIYAEGKKHALAVGLTKMSTANM
jgi:hypothetical protein